MNNIIKWLDEMVFPLESPQEMAEAAVVQVTRDLLKAQDQLDYALSVVNYKEKQLARLLKQTGVKCPINITPNQ